MELQHAARNDRSGFTLIELMVVVSIIAILGAIGITGIQYVINQANITKTQALIGLIGGANEQYLLSKDWGKYYARNGSDVDDTHDLVLALGGPSFYTGATPPADSVQFCDFKGSEEGSFATGWSVVDSWGNALHYANIKNNSTGASSAPVNSGYQSINYKRLKGFDIWSIGENEVDDSKSTTFSSGSWEDDITNWSKQ